MKNIIQLQSACFFIALLFAGCENKVSKNNNDIELARLIGKVKSISTRDSDGNFYSNITYNQNGYEIETEVNESDFPVHVTYKRDDKNNIIEKTEDGSSEGSKYKILTTFKYDNKNNMVESKIYNLEGALNEVFSYRYNENGSQIEESRTFSNTGMLYSRKYEYKYDKNNNVIEKLEPNALAYNVNKITYNHDDNGNQIYQQQTKKDGTNTSTEIFKYDDRNNKIEEGKCYENSASLFAMSYYKFDENDNLIEEKINNSDGSLSYISNYEYEFDKNGNWIKQTNHYKDQFSNTKIFGIKERTIEYY